jgi:DNA-binding XRE family transcriptional regulator
MVNTLKSCDQKGYSMTRTKPFRDLAASARADPRRAARIEQHKRAIDDILALTQIRQQRGVTQRDLASRLGVSQANVSRIEREDDVYVSTLRRYVEALGGELEITAVFGDERVSLSNRGASTC